MVLEFAPRKSDFEVEVPVGKLGLRLQECENCPFQLQVAGLSANTTGAKKRWGGRVAAGDLVTSINRRSLRDVPFAQAVAQIAAAIRTPSSIGFVKCELSQTSRASRASRASKTSKASSSSNRNPTGRGEESSSSRRREQPPSAPPLSPYIRRRKERENQEEEKRASKKSSKFISMFVVLAMMAALAFISFRHGKVLKRRYPYMYDYDRSVHDEFSPGQMKDMAQKENSFLGAMEGLP
jgi:hypothetical protein